MNDNNPFDTSKFQINSLGNKRINSGVIVLNYIIAQGAAANVWDKFYDIDPGATGLHPIHSVHKTPEGVGIQELYTEKEFNNAIKDCELLNNRYPDKGYAVVRML